MKIFYDIIFDGGELSPHTPAPRPTAIVFNGIDTRVSGIDILECEFGVCLCESNIFNGICNEMINGIASQREDGGSTASYVIFLFFFF